MKNQTKILLSLAGFLILSGCGSDSESQSNYDVIVERGPVYDANVTDSSGQVATQVEDGNNTYRFDEEIVYPVTASGGWVDVDRDGNLTENDVMLDVNLSSYSNVVTPTTTLLADANESEREEILDTLEEITGADEEELLGDPSVAPRNSLIVLNAVYEKLVERFADRNNTNAKSPIALEAVLARYNELNATCNVDENLSGEELAEAIETQTIERLENQNMSNRPSAEEIAAFRESRGRPDFAGNSDTNTSTSPGNSANAGNSSANSDSSPGNSANSGNSNRPENPGNSGNSNRPDNAGNPNG